MLLNRLGVLKRWHMLTRAGRGRWPLASRPAPVLVHHRDPGKPVSGHTLPNGVGPARGRRQHESHGQLLRQQRARGTLLQFAEERTRAASAVSESGRGPAGDRGVYLGVLDPPALASGAGLSEPSGVRADGRSVFIQVSVISEPPQSMNLLRFSAYCYRSCRSRQMRE